jgi:hypothetical protein
MNKLYVTIAGLALAAITGCGATRVPLQYDYPIARLKPDGPIIGCRGTEDRRTDRQIDEVLDGGSVTAVDKTIREETASAGVAQKVVPVPSFPQRSNQELMDQGVSVMIEPALEEMAWEVPNYTQIWATTFIVSVLTGGVGGLIYTSTPTDVYGRTKLTVRMIDVASGREITKTYAGSSQERMAKLSSDRAETRSKMVGQSLSSAMQQFRTDLVSFAGKPAAPGYVR